jgi:hypothetical protein
MAMVKIVHPDLGEGSVTEVDEAAAPHYYRSGWRLLTDDEQAARGQAAPGGLVAEPKPMTRAQAARAAKAAAKESEE